MNRKTVNALVTLIVLWAPGLWIGNAAADASMSSSVEANLKGIDGVPDRELTGNTLIGPYSGSFSNLPITTLSSPYGPPAPGELPAHIWAAGFGWANRGHLQVIGQVDGLYGGQGWIDATASTRDTLLLKVPGNYAPGQEIKFYFRFYVEGGEVVHGWQAWANVTADAWLNGYHVAQHEEYNQVDSFGQKSDYHGFYTDGMIDFPNGEPLVLSMSMKGSANVNSVGYEGQGSQSTLGTQAYFIYGRSFYWAGVQKVTIDGVEVPFTLTDDAGLDYSKSFVPVPEPGSYALLGIGIVATLVRRLRRPSPPA